MAAADLVEYVAKSLVDDPEAVKVEVVRDQRRDRHRAPRRRGRHGQGHRPQRQRRQGAPDAPQGHRRPRRRAGLAGDPVGHRHGPRSAGSRRPGSGWSSPSSAASRPARRGPGRDPHGPSRGPLRRRAPSSIARAPTTPLTVDWSSAVGDGPGWRLHFAEVTTREAADALRGAYLECVAGPEARAAARRVLLARGRRHGRVAASTAPSSGRSATSTARAAPRSSSSTAGRTASSTCPRVRGFVRIFAPRRGEIVVDVEALDLTPPKPRAAGDRPKAPRRKPGPRRKARTPAEAAEPGTDRAAGRTGRRTRPPPRILLTHARDRRPDAVPGDDRGAARREHPRPDPGARARRRSGPTTCGSGGWAGIAASTTPRTAAARGWSCGRSRSLPRSTPCAAPDSLRHPAGPGRRGLPPGAGPRPRDAVPPDPASAPATRASTSGSARSSISSCRSATTC